MTATLSSCTVATSATRRFCVTRGTDVACREDAAPGVIWLPHTVAADPATIGVITWETWAGASRFAAMNGGSVTDYADLTAPSVDTTRSCSNIVE